MAKKHTTRKSQHGKKPSDDLCHSCGEEDWGEHEDEVRTAVEESMRRFVLANLENIRKSSKERIASASYCGGMVDMMAVIRSALGKWAVERLMIELEKWHSTSCSGRVPQMRVSLAGIDMAGISSDDAKELGEQIARWIENRKSGSKRQCKDPMFG